MADFDQTGMVTTLHRLTHNHIERLEADLERFGRSRPIGSVLPALASEFETPATRRIVSTRRSIASGSKATVSKICSQTWKNGDYRRGQMAKGGPAGSPTGIFWPGATAYSKKFNLSVSLAGQAVGVKEVDNGIWLVSFMHLHYDLGYIDLEEKTLQPLENPFGPKVLPMS